MLRGIRGFLLLVGLILIAMVGYALWEQKRLRPSLPSLIGSYAPALTLQKIGEDGRLKPETLRLEDFRGQWVILNFWASWCVECQKEVGILNAFWETLPEGIPLAVVGVNIWDSPRGIRQFIQKYPIRFFNGRDLSQTAGARYGLTGVPETFLVDPKGVIRDHVLGPVRALWLEGIVQKIQENHASNVSTATP